MGVSDNGLAVNCEYSVSRAKSCSLGRTVIVDGTNKLALSSLCVQIETVLLYRHVQANAVLVRFPTWPSLTFTTKHKRGDGASFGNLCWTMT